MTKKSKKNNKTKVSAEVLKSASAHKISPGMAACRLSPSCLQYCEAVRDPFAAVAPWIPTFPIRASLTVPIRYRGSFYTGAGSLGYVVIGPQKFLCDDANAGYYTIAGNTLTPASTIVSDAAQNAGIIPNAPYAQASFGTGAFDATARLVACGLRVWYGGTKLEEGGEIYIGRMINNENAYGSILSSVMSSNCCSWGRADSRVFQTTWVPVDMDDFDYNDYASLPSAQPMFAIVQSAEANQHWNFEVVAHWEVSHPMGLWAQGSGLTSRNQTAQQIVHPVDPSGTQVVTAALQHANQTQSPPPTGTTARSMMESVRDVMATAAEAVSYASYVGQFAAGAVGHAQRFRHAMGGVRPARQAVARIEL